MFISYFKYGCSIMLALSVSVTNLQAEVYKWVDEKGQTHYTQTPPRHIEAETVKTRKGPTVTPAQSQQAVDTMIEQQASADEAKLKQQAEASAERDKAQKLAKNCEIAKNNLKKYQDNPNGRRINAQGEVERVDEKQRQKRIAELQKDIQKYCR